MNVIIGGRPTSSYFLLSFSFLFPANVPGQK
jgi:hypothetical protein